MANKPPCNPGDVTNKCKLCVEEPYFDPQTAQLAYNQIIQALQGSGYSQAEILKRAQEAYQAAGRRFRPVLVPYNSVYACSRCETSEGPVKVIGNISPDPLKLRNISSPPIVFEKLKQCIDCADELIPSNGTSYPKYRAKWISRLDPKSCDSCELVRDEDGEWTGEIVTDGKCLEIARIARDPRYTWEAVYVKGQCECVRRCRKCASCEECYRPKVASKSEECRSKCPQPNYVCTNDVTATRACYCKFRAWVENPEIDNPLVNYNSPFAMCPPDKPWVKIRNNNTDPCECECRCTKTNEVCATADNLFLGCKCKFVTREQYDNMMRPGGTGYFSQVTVCDGSIRATADGGCSCCNSRGGAIQIQSTSPNCAINWFFDEPTCQCKPCPIPCIGSNIRAPNSCDCVCPISQPGGPGCPPDRPYLNSRLCTCSCPTSVIMSCSQNQRFDASTCSCVYDTSKLSILLEP